MLAAELFQTLHGPKRKLVSVTSMIHELDTELLQRQQAWYAVSLKGKPCQVARQQT